MTVQEARKRAAAERALTLVPPGQVIGVGTGSTANFFIAGLAGLEPPVPGAVSSSRASTERLEAAGIPVLKLDQAGILPLYVDGADEATRGRSLLKGGGGALTREKIVAQASRSFVCILDDSKLVERLGAFPLPVEFVPMARRSVARAIEALGGRPVLREGFVTDNGMEILDVHDLGIDDPAALEAELNQIPGVLTNGLFARRGADLLLVAGPGGVDEI